jgi:tetratricopeptide (TPR) repeat protein
VVVLLACMGIAHADDDDDAAAAREHYRNGTKAFELGDFDGAIREYSEAYRLKDDPAILYNLGQAHRLAQHPSEALHFYRMYLIKVPDSPDRSEVEAKIESLQKSIEEQRNTQSAPPMTPVAPPAPEPRAEAVKAAPPMRAEVKAAPPMPPSRAKKIAGIVVGGFGVSLIATGAAFGALAKNNGDALTRLAQMGAFDYGKQQAGLLDQKLAPVFLVIGGAAVVGGAVLYVLGHRQATRERHRALSAAPVVARGYVGLSTQVGF